MSIKNHIPNLITCLNLFCGILACMAALQGDVVTTFGLLVLSAIFDFSDGLAARLLKAYSPMGKELDSLADMISFSLVPGFLTFSLLRQLTLSASSACVAEYVPYIAFMIPVFSALRLAKFNIDERQSDSFIGMPTPANALFWVSFALSMSAAIGTVVQTHPVVTGLMSQWLGWFGDGVHWAFVVVLVILFSLLLTSEVPMFSLKFKTLSWAANRSVYLFLILAVALIVLFGTLGVALTILCYILFSLITHLSANRTAK